MTAAAASRVNPRDIFTEAELAGLRAGSQWRGPALTLHAWATIALAAWVGATVPVLLPLAVMVIGARQLGLAILMHEAAHGLLHPNARLNAFLGQWLCAAPVGADLDRYRPYHLKHHRHAQQALDPDLILSAAFPCSPASLRRKIIRDLTGQTFYRQRIAPLLRPRRAGATAEPAGDDPTAVIGARDLLAHLLANIFILGVFAATGHPLGYVLFWLLPLATWFPLATRLRNIAEHAVTTDPDDPFRHARTTRAGVLERLLIAPYWVNYHCEHHLFMWMPCWSLPRAHRLLGDKGYWPRMEIKRGYASVLRAAAGG